MADDPTNDGGGTDTPPPAPAAEDVAALRRQLDAQKKRADDLEAAEKLRRDSELSEIERYKKASTESTSALEAERKARKTDRIQFAFERHAAKEGVADTDAAWRLANVAGLDLDESGNLTGVKDVMKALKEQRAYLFGNATPTPKGSNGGAPAGGATKKTDFTAEQIDAMSSKEFNELYNNLRTGVARF